MTDHEIVEHRQANDAVQGGLSEHQGIVLAGKNLRIEVANLYASDVNQVKVRFAHPDLLFADPHALIPGCNVEAQSSRSFGSDAGPTHPSIQDEVKRTLAIDLDGDEDTIV